MLEKHQHCNYCTHQEKNVFKGTLCGLTHEKPNFNKTCPKIQWSTLLSKKITAVHTLNASLEKDQLYTYVKTILLIVLAMSMGLALSAYVQTEEFIRLTSEGFAVKSYKIYAIPVSLVAAMIILVLYAVKSFVNYLKAKKEANQKKQQLDTLLQLYGISFRKAVELSEEKNGIEQLNSLTKINGIS